MTSTADRLSTEAPSAPGRRRGALLFGAGSGLLICGLLAYWGGSVRSDPLFVLGLVVLSAMIVAAGAVLWWLFASPLPAGAHVIRSPMVGTFYRAPEPGAPPFVEVGARVQPDTIVCIIEVMKLMNSVPAGVAGVVTHVLAENAHMVEYGQALIAIKGD